MKDQRSHIGEMNSDQFMELVVKAIHKALDERFNWLEARLDRYDDEFISLHNKLEIGEPDTERLEVLEDLSQLHTQKQNVMEEMLLRHNQKIRDLKVV